ncbi:F-box/kelch-repeat protein At3g06240-like [Lycium barbarum]|uniref:F-box/kelch-repeat protein At3g06240-like n=1 Tax=Lycium barbarum TaxID=112863 RepID=UPI00293E9F17|nr:F-box/kelch-repeat protein At3g06240-like [Lycium barbarum]
MDETSSCLFLGSCHGLILFNVNEHISLWNPSIRFRAKVLELYIMLGDYYTHGGLCFDTSKNVYKAVLIGSEFVIVASLEDKQWRLLEFPYDILSVCDGITLHGRIHCRVRVKESYISYNEHLTNALVCFDPASEKFHTFPVPEPKSDQEENAIAGLGVLNECLCMTQLQDDKSVEILVMKEYGVKESWTSLFFISNSELDPYLGTIAPLFMTDNGEFVLVTWNSEKVVLYNPKNNNILNVVVDGKTEYIWGTIRYVESLISPKEYVLL